MKNYMLAPILMVLLSAPLVGEESNKPTTKEIYNNSNQSCLYYEGYERTGGNTGQLHFKNNCSTRVEGIVCVVYPDGTKETVTSTNRIYKKGRWNVSLTRGTAPLTVTTSAAVNDVKPPAPCS